MRVMRSTGMRCILRAQKEDYADRHLRTALGMEHGDVVDVEVPERTMARFTLHIEVVCLAKRATRVLTHGRTRLAPGR